MTITSRFLKVLSVLLVFFIILNPGYGKKKKKEKDPIELLRDKWGTFDWRFDDNWQVGKFVFFVLRSPEYLDEYFKLLREKQEISEEIISKEKAVLEEYLVVEVSLEAINKNDLNLDKWKFELKDKDGNKFKPIHIEATPVTKGREYIASFKAFKPITMQKKRGDVTIESSTPVFYLPDKASNWVCTCILYFPKNNPETEMPIYHKDAKELRIRAKTKAARLSGTWKIDKILGKK